MIPDLVGDVGDVGLGLADADRLDHDHVERGRQRSRGGTRRAGQSPEPVARGRRADEHAPVVGIAVDARAVAEQRSPRAPRAGVDREHRHRPIGGAPPGDEL
jgi:hypothetical protein